MTNFLPLDVVSASYLAYENDQCLIGTPCDLHYQIEKKNDNLYWRDFFKRPVCGYSHS